MCFVSVSRSPQTSYVPSSKATWAGNTSSFMVHFFSIGSHVEFIPFFTKYTPEVSMFNTKKWLIKDHFLRIFQELALETIIDRLLFHWKPVWVYAVLPAVTYLPHPSVMRILCSEPRTFKNKRSSSWHLDKTTKSHGRQGMMPVGTMSWPCLYKYFLYRAWVKIKRRFVVDDGWTKTTNI